MTEDNCKHCDTDLGERIRIQPKYSYCPWCGCEIIHESE